MGARRSDRTCYVAQDKHGNSVLMTGLSHLDILPMPEEFVLADGAPLVPHMEVWYPYERQWVTATHLGLVSLDFHRRMWTLRLPGATVPLEQVYGSRPSINAPVPAPPAAAGYGLTSSKSMLRGV